MRYRLTKAKSSAAEHSASGAVVVETKVDDPSEFSCKTIVKHHILVARWLVDEISIPAENSAKFLRN